MLDFEVQRSSRKCYATERELKPGQVCYSVLIAEGSDVSRRDYCEEAWPGEPDQCLGWWKSQIPSPSSQKQHWAPNDVMLHYFQQLDGIADKEDVRYVLALLMIRRRIFRLEETEVDAEQQEQMLLFCPRDENEYRVRVVNPSSARAAEIQQELGLILYSDEPTS